MMMKTARWVKVTCFVLALLLLAACGGPSEPEDGSIDPRAVAIELDLRPVLWEEFYFDLQNGRAMLESGGPIEDWDAIVEGQTFFDSEVTYNEFVIRLAVDTALERRAIETLFTEELGESLEEDFYDEIRELFIGHHGFDEEAFQEFLAEHHLTEDTFRYLNEVMAMFDMVGVLLYGPNGEEAPDEAVEALIEEQGILRAQHILLSTQDEDRQDLPEEEIALISARAMELYEELAALTGDAQRARFQEMLDAYGEDPGMHMSPEGYTFTPGVMVPEFTAGTQALEINEISAPIRSDFGYHIILRLSPARDAVAMQFGGGQTPPIQSMAAMIQIQRVLEQIRSELVYTLTPLVTQTVPSELFARTSADVD